MTEQPAPTPQPMDYLGLIAARHLEQALPALQPRLPSRYEPVAPLEMPPALLPPDDDTDETGWDEVTLAPEPAGWSPEPVTVQATPRSVDRAEQPATPPLHTPALSLEPVQAEQPTPVLQRMSAPVTPMADVHPVTPISLKPVENPAQPIPTQPTPEEVIQIRQTGDLSPTTPSTSVGRAPDSQRLIQPDQVHPAVRSTQTEAAADAGWESPEPPLEPGSREDIGPARWSAPAPRRESPILIAPTIVAFREGRDERQLPPPVLTGIAQEPGMEAFPPEPASIPSTRQSMADPVIPIVDGALAAPRWAVQLPGHEDQATSSLVPTPPAHMPADDSFRSAVQPQFIDERVQAGIKSVMPYHDHLPTPASVAVPPPLEPVLPVQAYFPAAPAAEPAPTVNVHIGLIEVKMTPPAEARPAVSRNKPQTQGLDDYLRGRDRGNRR